MAASGSAISPSHRCVFRAVLPDTRPRTHEAENACANGCACSAGGGAMDAGKGSWVLLGRPGGGDVAGLRTGGWQGNVKIRPGLLVLLTTRSAADRAACSRRVENGCGAGCHKDRFFVSDTPGGVAAHAGAGLFGRCRVVASRLWFRPCFRAACPLDSIPDDHGARCLVRHAVWVARAASCQVERDLLDGTLQTALDPFERSAFRFILSIRRGGACWQGRAVIRTSPVIGCAPCRF